MSYRETEHLRVLIANERKDRLALVAPIVASLGHEVIAREIEVDDVGPVTARERPGVALVGLGESSEHALTLIEKIVQESACPVIVLIHAPDPDFVKEASKRGGEAPAARSAPSASPRAGSRSTERPGPAWVAAHDRRPPRRRCRPACGWRRARGHEASRTRSPRPPSGVP
jgi:chemotaxis response regulator CheB